MYKILYRTIDHFEGTEISEISEDSLEYLLLQAKEGIKHDIQNYENKDEVISVIEKVLDYIRQKREYR